jgi:hypothetical protein
VITEVGMGVVEVHVEDSTIGPVKGDGGMVILFSRSVSDEQDVWVRGRRGDGVAVHSVTTISNSGENNMSSRGIESTSSTMFPF